jgi:outer membrane protein, heavy metal efflux system
MTAEYQHHSLTGTDQCAQPQTERAERTVQGCAHPLEPSSCFNSKRGKGGKCSTTIYPFFAFGFLVIVLSIAPAHGMTDEATATSLSKQTNSSYTNPGSTVTPLRTLSLGDCFQKATENNKEIIANQYNLPIAKAGIQIAGAIPNPQFTLLYGFGPAFKEILAGNPQQFGWQEQLQTAGKRTKQLNVARANYRLTEIQIAQNIFDVHNRVRRAYAELAAAEAYVNLIEAEKKVASELLHTANKRLEAGKAAKSEFLQAQMGVLQFDTQNNLAEARLEQASSAMSLLIGETPAKVEVIDVDDNGIFKLSAEKTDIVPPSSRALPPLEQLLPAGYSQRPDLKAAIQQAFVDRRALSLARAQRIPNISVDSGYQFTTFTPEQPHHLFPFNVPNSPGCYLNVSAELPFFYQHQGETSQAKAVWLQDYDQIDQITWQVATDIVTAYESATVARANIGKFQKQLIPAAAQVAKQARLRYEIGKSDLSTAILAKQQYQQILSSYFDAVVAYQNAWADLEKAVGAPLQL